MSDHTIGTKRCLRTYIGKTRVSVLLKKMEWKEKYSLTLLEQYTYRQLQKIAKEMVLPSNVKKVYLIQLIHTKVFGSQNEINSIMQRVKLERLQKANARLNRPRNWAHQLPSPPIAQTPKRLQDNHIQRSLQYVDHIKTYSYNERVLRNRPSRSQAEVYGVMNINNTIIGVLKTEDNPPKNLKNAPIIKIYRQPSDSRALMPNEETAQKRRSTVNNPIPPLPAKRPRRLSGIYPIPAQPPRNKYHFEFVEGTLMIKNANGTLSRADGTTKTSTTHTVTQATQTQPRNLSKKPNILSSKNSKTTQNCGQATQNCEQSTQNYEQSTQNCEQSTQNCEQSTQNCETSTQNCVQSTQNTSKQQSNSNSQKESNYIELEQVQSAPEINYTVPIEYDSNNQYTESMENCAQALLNLTRDKENSCDTNNERNPEVLNSREEITNVPYNYVLSLNETPTNNSLTYTRNTRYTSTENESSVEDYFHKKIRAELVRNRRGSRLPRVAEAFGRAAGGAVYDQYYMTAVTTSTPVLEAIYNIRGLITETDIEAGTTRTVYTTPVYVTTMVQPSYVYEPYTVATYEPVSEYYHQENPYNYYNMAEQDPTSRENHDRNQGQRSSSTNTSTTTQVEDALELISQDGDYMERIGMDVRTACLLCGWEGPRVILEKHIRKEHASQIHKYQSLWATCYSLSELCTGAARVCAGATGLILLQAATVSGALRARLASLAPNPMTPQFGSITTYNRLTGVPFTWEGELPPLSPIVADEGQNPLTDEGLVVPLRDLDLCENGEVCDGVGVVLFVKL